MNPCEHRIGSTNRTKPRPHRQDVSSTRKTRSTDPEPITPWTMLEQGFDNHCAEIQRSATKRDPQRGRSEPGRDEFNIATYNLYIRGLIHRYAILRRVFGDWPTRRPTGHQRTGRCPNTPDESRTSYGTAMRDGSRPAVTHVNRSVGTVALRADDFGSAGTGPDTNSAGRRGKSDPDLSSTRCLPEC